MADLTLPDPKTLGQPGHVAAHAAIRQGLADADARLDALEAKWLKGIVSATEPTHDGSQEDGDLWIKRP